ncbi:hypothetical protein JCM3263A_17100 [Thermobifida fusca]|jgi:hypothetical protein|uniref:DUF4235 domain-containing protein n=2 Tax=Thermobifida fusca TaxID=2021 RepID=A0A9P2TB49_THEFU|nr:DUF4235 domain-containing protein [Thermobifida fusca]AAZ55970.1 hypothetical protein Tfu_1937 [Thermobifida fusca YX]EOR71016.1 hypothetical protein TM51_09976 [Thermobifida fusca TM51]PZN61595.1 MAG: DUF4235 domain-containing protein [Thermobifida fusca]QOS58473.1 DUF4235 domain-containing protein [Thermobifida fusca]
MADKDGDLAARIIGGVAALAAAYVTRKALTLLWTKAVGKEPPADPESPDISLGEALGWAVLTGVGMEVTRVLAVRTVHKRLAARAPRAPERPQR